MTKPPCQSNHLADPTTRGSKPQLIELQSLMEEQPPHDSQDATSDLPEQADFLTRIETHHRMLLKVCWTYTSNSHDRDDLFQEVVGRLWAAFGTYDRNRTFSTWMYRVALNVAIDFRRRQTTRKNEVVSFDDMPESKSQHSAAQQELQRELHELLQRQSEADRAILLLYLEGNSHREIAEVVGISESNVGTRLNRLKVSLRQAAQASGN